MLFYESSVLFLYGIIIGSFLNVCIYRLPLGESVVYTPSHCMKCNHRLGVLDLFPVFSYIFLKGKCRYCGAKVSVQYPIVELVNGMLYLSVYFTLGTQWYTLLVMLLSSSLLVVFMTDIKHQIIPDMVNIFIFILAVIELILYPEQILSHVIGFFVVSGLFVFIALVTGNMGGGDIKLMAVAGLFLGWVNILLALVIASLIGSIISLGLMVTKKAGLKTPVPFGVFLAPGILIAALWGADLIKLYLSFVLK